MPNRYWREIDEILRNMDRTEPRQGLSERIRAFNRPRVPKRRTIRTPLKLTEVLALIGIALMLVGAGIAFTTNHPSLLSGLVGLAGFVVFVLGLVQAWTGRIVSARRNPMWRGNVVDMRPPRRNPFSAIATRFRILRLKLRYRRQRGQEHDD